jgi:uncharacterized protein YjbK
MTKKQNEIYYFEEDDVKEMAESFLDDTRRRHHSSLLTPWVLFKTPAWWGSVEKEYILMHFHNKDWVDMNHLPQSRTCKECKKTLPEHIFNQMLLRLTLE